MTSPPTLLVLSSTTFQTLHIVPSTSLEPFSPLPHHSTATTAASSATLGLGHHSSQASPPQSPIIPSKPLPLDRLSIDDVSHDNSGNHYRRQYHLDNPHPIFALSHCLLAYASPSPSLSPLHVPSSIKSKHRLSSSSSTAFNANSSLSSSPTPFSFSLGLGSGPIGMANVNFGKVTNMTQADLGQAALKAGETVLGGMKLLSGMAYGAARSRVGGGGDVGRASRGGEGLVSAGLGGRFVSRSAPDTAPVVDAGRDEVITQNLRERRLSNTSSVSGYHITTVAPSTKSSISASYGYYNHRS
ncbi:hypothetical protein BYT27DRAFT_6375673 [Phlegmacium glaucopus]|nr:hypothetical protein BYT27DRAFT_6375673 [Phlegmacium glaucopus]